MQRTASDVRNAFKYLFPDELPALQELVSWLPSEAVIINIGAGAGTSGLAIMEQRKDITLLTVDITDSSSPLGCLEAERQVFTQANLENLWGRRWFQFHGSSTDMFNHLQKNKGVLICLKGMLNLSDGVNMIFIDGEHSYDGCKSDILHSLEILKEGGILAVHDYLKDAIPANPNGPHPKSWPGVDAAVREFLFHNPNVEPIMHVDSLIAFKVTLDVR